MDPPEFRTSRSPWDRWAYGRNPKLTIRSVKIWAGPSRRPSGINALTFGRAKITLIALWRDSEANEGQRKRQALAGRAARAERFRTQDECRLFSPANRPARGLGAKPKLEARSNEQDPSFSRARAGIRLRRLLSTAWRPPTKDGAEKKNR